MIADHYTYRVTWAPEDEEYVGLCAEFPLLSWLAATQDGAFAGIRQLVADCVADMQANNETPAAPEEHTQTGSNAMTTAKPLPRGEIVQQLDGTYELFPLPTDEDTLSGILKDCLAEWEHIRIGMLIPGAVWEIKPPCAPRLGYLDGYLTVDFREWHLHLCIGESKSAPPEAARLRRAARAELYRRLNPDRQPTSWGFRLFNGGGQQQITVLLPNPHLDEQQNYMERPDWSRLYLWDRLRRKYLSQGEDPVDRSAPRFYHG